MINAFIILLGCQFAGEVIVTLTGLPVPGAIIGMFLLLTGLFIRGDVPEYLEQTTSNLMTYLGLLFVPAGAGLSLYLSLIQQQWLVILVASFTSTCLTLIVTAFVYHLLSKRPPQ